MMKTDEFSVKVPLEVSINGQYVPFHQWFLLIAILFLHL